MIYANWLFWPQSQILGLWGHQEVFIALTSLTWNFTIGALCPWTQGLKICLSWVLGSPVFTGPCFLFGCYRQTLFLLCDSLLMSQMQLCFASLGLLPVWWNDTLVSCVHSLVSLVERTPASCSLTPKQMRKWVHHKVPPCWSGKVEKVKENNRIKCLCIFFSKHYRYFTDYSHRPELRSKV